jgi:hypothetical protein
VLEFALLIIGRESKRLELERGLVDRKRSNGLDVLVGIVRGLRPGRNGSKSKKGSLLSLSPFSLLLSLFLFLALCVRLSLGCLWGIVSRIVGFMKGRLKGRSILGRLVGRKKAGGEGEKGSLGERVRVGAGGKVIVELKGDES